MIYSKKYIISIVSIILCTGGLILGILFSINYIKTHSFIENNTLVTYTAAHRVSILSKYYSDQTDKIWNSNSRPVSIRLIEEIDNIISDTSLHLYPTITTEKILGICSVESGFNERIISNANAIGIMQVQVATGKSMDPLCTKDKLLKRKYNLRIGIKYYSKLLYQFDGDNDIALLAYNRGPAKVNKLLSININPDNGYPDKIYNSTLSTYEYQSLACNIKN